MERHRTHKLKLNDVPSSAQRVSAVILVIGTLLFFTGLFHRANTENQTTFSSGFTGALEARNFAIRNALKNNSNDYSFTTNFIPGIGIIGNPQSYLDKWEKAQILSK